MSRFVTLPSGAHVNLALVEEIKVAPTATSKGRWQITVYLASSRTVLGGWGYDSEADAVHAVEAIINGAPQLFEETTTLTPVVSAVEAMIDAQACR